MRITRTSARVLAHRSDQYADQNADAPEAGETFEIPEALTELSDADIEALHSDAIDAFNAVRGDGSDLSDESLEQLAALADGIEGIKAEREQRLAAAAERKEKADALSARVNPADKDDESDDEDAADEDAEEKADDEDEDAEDGKDEDESAADTVTASARRRGPVSVKLPRRADQHLPKAHASKAATMRDVAFAAGEGSGYAAGEGIDFNDAAKIVGRRLSAVNEGTVRAAARAGRTFSQRSGVMSIRKPIPEDLVIGNNDPAHVEGVLKRAVDEKAIASRGGAGNSLVASGGWCAPSETLYDLLELETRDGLFSLPEVGMARGGIQRTLGPNFADIYSAFKGFHFTEEQDIAGKYGVDADGIGNGTAGTKPCYKVDCPEFEEFRLELDGLCITAGLLQQKSYPEMIARTVRGALIAHDHRLAGRDLAAIEAGSTAVTMPTEDGALAPLLSAIELQVEHVRYTQRLSRSASLEFIAPFWLRGALRADLSRRNGVDLLSVTDAQLNGWFAARGVAPQFVYNWQDLNGVDAAAATGWPDAVKFLLYPAGSWVRGSSDVITVDTLIDSSLLATNDFTALFTEEGRVVVPMGHDSRVVTVPLDPSGVSGQQANLGGHTISLTGEAPAGE